MNYWVIGIIVAVIVIAGIGLFAMNSVNATEKVPCGTCGQKCSETGNCGLETCKATTGGTCNCGK